MSHKKITIILIVGIFCVFVMCMQTGKDRLQDVRDDTTQYNDKPPYQPIDTFVLRGTIKSIKGLYKDRYNDIRKDTTQYDNKPSYQPVDTFVLRGTIKSIKGLYSESLILHSLSFVLIDKFKDFFTFIGEDDSLASDANWNNIGWRSFNLYGFDLWIDSVIAAKPAVVDSLLFVVQNMKGNEAVIKQIWNWCETYTVLMAGYNYGGSSDTYVETLFEMPEMYPVTRLFIDTTMQDWASLSSSQVFYLPFEISNYLSTLPDKERLLFYKSLFERTRYEEN